MIGVGGSVSFFVGYMIPPIPSNLGAALRYSCTPELLNFRVEPAVSDWLPHSPVRAQLRHTVLQARLGFRCVDRVDSFCVRKRVKSLDQLFKAFPGHTPASPTS